MEHILSLVWTKYATTEEINILPKVIIKPHAKRQNKRGKNIEETFGCVRQERVIR